MLYIADSTFKANLDEHPVLVVDFSAEWCGPCKRMAPAFEQVAENLKDKATFAKADIELCPEYSVSFLIESVPTLVVFKNGSIFARHSGAMNEQDLEAWVTENLA